MEERQLYGWANGRAITLWVDKVGRAIPLWGAIKNSQILLSQYWKNEQIISVPTIILNFGCTNNILVECNTPCELNWKINDVWKGILPGAVILYFDRTAGIGIFHTFTYY